MFIQGAPISPPLPLTINRGSGPISLLVRPVSIYKGETYQRPPPVRSGGGSDNPSGYDGNPDNDYKYNGVAFCMEELEEQSSRVQTFK